MLLRIWALRRVNVSAVLFVLAASAGACGRSGSPPNEVPIPGPVPARPQTTAPSPPAPSGFTSAADGRILFENACGTCHGPSGSGLPGQGPSLTDSVFVTGPPDLLIRIVLDGVRSADAERRATYVLPMPAWRILEDREVAAIVVHLRSPFGPKLAPVDDETVAVVRKMTEGRSRPWTPAELRTVQVDRSSR